MIKPFEKFYGRKTRKNYNILIINKTIRAQVYYLIFDWMKKSFLLIEKKMKNKKFDHFVKRFYEKK